MKKVKCKENRKPTSLTIGSLAFGGLLFCSLNEVDADIVASSVGNFDVNVGDTNLLVDIDGNGQNDLRFFNNAYTHSVQAASASALLRYNGTVVYSNYQVRGFATGLGTYVISGSNQSRHNTAFLAFGTVAGDDWPGEPGVPVTRNFAFEFRNEATDEINYGWGTIIYNGPENNLFTVTQLFYENEGNSIRVGELGAIPEPSSITLLALGAAGIGAYRRRRKAS